MMRKFCFWYANRALYVAVVGLLSGLFGDGAQAGGTQLASPGTNGGSFCTASTQGNPCDRAIGVMHYGAVDHSGALKLWDQPLEYETQYGPRVSFGLSLDPQEPRLLSGVTNAGGWTLSVSGYATTVPADAGHPDGGIRVMGGDGGYEDYVAGVGAACGALSAVRCEYPRDGLSKNGLIRWGGDAAAWSASATHGAVPPVVQALARDPHSVVRVSPQGTYEVYGGTIDAVRSVSNGQELWLSAMVDRQGLAVRFRYETVHGVLRLTDVGDATIESLAPPVRNASGGIVSGSSLGWLHFYYPDSDPRYQSAAVHDWTVNELGLSNAGVFGLVTAVENPYGDQAQLEYQDLVTGLWIGEVPSVDAALYAALRERSQHFRLVTSRDVVGVESNVQYQCGARTRAGSTTELDSRRSEAVARGCLNAEGTQWGINALLVELTHTPYGDTKYRRLSVDAGGMHRRGWIVTNPVGMSERWEAVFGELDQAGQSQLRGLLGDGPGTRPTHIPAEAWSRLLIRPSPAYRLSCHWTYKAMWDLLSPTGDEMPALDHAQIKQYLHDYPLHAGGQPTTSPVLAASREPLEEWVYYGYPGSASADTYRNSSMTGETSALPAPMVVARRLDDGSTQATYVSYNEQGQPQVVVDALGRALEMVYAANGIDATDVYQGRWDAAAVMTAGRGNDGITRLERLAHSEYNDRGQLTRSQGAGEADVVTLEYEPSAPYRLRATINGLGRSYGMTSYTWSVPYGLDARVRVERLQTVTPDGLVTTQDYQRGHLIQVSSAGRTRSWGDFDALGRPGSASMNGELKARYGYRGLDLISTRNVIDGSTVRVDTDYLGRPSWVRLEDGSGAVRRQTYRAYDASGGLSTLWSGLVWGEYVGWDYDLAGRLRKRWDTDGTTQEVSYERTTSRLHGVSDGRGIWTYLSYDAGNQVTAKRLRTETAVPLITLRYGTVYGRLEQRSDAIGATVYHYDGAQPYRLRSVDEPLPAGISGARTTTASFGYDRLNRSTGYSVTDEVSGGAVQSALGIGYDDLHQGRVSRYETPLYRAIPRYDAMDNWHQFGEVNQVGYELGAGGGSQVVQTIGRSESYDDRRVNRLSYTMGSESVSSGIGFDGLGRVNRVEGLLHGAVRDYAYDERGEVTRSSLWRGSSAGMMHQDTRGYEYDDAGNRKNVWDEAQPLLDGTEGARLSGLQHAEYGASNRIGTVTQGGMTQAVMHDGAGHVTSNPLRNQSYTWDDAGRMVRIDYQGKTKPGQKSGGSTRITYDGLGQIRRIEEIDGMGATTEDSTYVWLADQLIQKRRTQDQTIVQSYQGDGYADHNADGTVTKYLLLKDYLGSVIGKTDASGRVLERVDYDAWGEVESRQVKDLVTGAMLDADPSASTLPFGHAGYWIHTRSGLSLTVHRQYDPKLGRWLSKDPIGELGGQNLYAYVGNSPVNATDPSGLAPWWEMEWLRDAVDGELWEQGPVVLRPLPRADDCREILRDMRWTIDKRDARLMLASRVEPTDAGFNLVSGIINVIYEGRIARLMWLWRSGPCGGGGFPASSIAMNRMLRRMPSRGARRDANDGAAPMLAMPKSQTTYWDLAIMVVSPTYGYGGRGLLDGAFTAPAPANGASNAAQAILTGAAAVFSLLLLAL